MRSNGLVIRSFGNMYCVCDGVDKNDPEAFAIGTRFSDWYDTWEEAEKCRRAIYDTVSQELQNAAVEFNNKDYENASKFLDCAHDI